MRTKIETDSVVAITGVASGIGAEVARQLDRDGIPLIGIDRQLSDNFPGEFIQADLGTPEGVRRAAADIQAASGTRPLVGLGNIAGVPGTAPWRTVLNVNVFGLRELTRNIAPQFSRGASVVNLSSSVSSNWRDRQADCHRFALAHDREAALDTIASRRDITEESYLFSKDCVRLLTETLAAELIPAGVRVNSVSPGPVETPILEDFRNDHGREKVNRAAELLGRFATPNDIARVVGFLFSADSAWVNGSDIRVDGGLTAYRNSGARAEGVKSTA